MTRLAALLVAATLFATPGHAQTTEAWQAPTLSITRYDEDWSDLADEAKRDHHWTGRFKYIPVDKNVWLSTGIELRARSESFENNLWGGAEAPDDAYLWLRALPYADLHAGRLRAFVQPMASYAVGVAPESSPVDSSGLDILQAFGEVDLGPAVLRAGRQMLSLGTERLVGTRYGPNVPLAFDGLRATVKRGRAKIDLLAMRPVQPGRGDFDDHGSKERDLWGLYAAIPELDIYYLGYRNRSARFGGVMGREERHSIGLRSYGARGDFHWNVEGVAQFGHFRDQRIRAWTIATEIGQRFPDAPLRPDAAIRFNVISGDRRSSDTRLQTFNALFPKGKYFGELSPIGPSNIVNLNPRVGLDFGSGVTGSIAAMAYWRYSRGDGVYNIPGALIRPAGTSRARFIGKQAEVEVAWQTTPELELSTSLSAFDAGRFLRESGPSKTILMLGFESNFRF